MTRSFLFLFFYSFFLCKILWTFCSYFDFVAFRDFFLLFPFLFSHILFCVCVCIYEVLALPFLYFFSLSTIILVIFLLACFLSFFLDIFLPFFLPFLIPIFLLYFIPFFLSFSLSLSLSISASISISHSLLHLIFFPNHFRIRFYHPHLHHMCGPWVWFLQYKSL